MAKHYIWVDKNKNIIKSHSDEFDLPDGYKLKEAILLGEGGRQFEMLGQTNPPLQDEYDIYLYKYIKNEVVQKTEAELESERPAPEEAPPEMTNEDIMEAFTVLGDEQALLSEEQAITVSALTELGDVIAEFMGGE